MLLSREPRGIVAFGAGAQVFAHLTLFMQAYPSISSCKIVNRTANERLRTLVHDLRARHPGVQVDGHASIDDRGEQSLSLGAILADADIVVTATSATEPLFPSRYVSAGTHLCLIGSYTPAM